MAYPSDLKYTDSHEWVKVEGDVITMGITQFAADQLTDITYVELPAVGSAVNSDCACGEIESVKATSEFFVAVAGEVVEINGDLEEHPEYLNTDPYGQGWMVKIKVDDPSAVDSLMDASAYEKHAEA